MTGHVLLYMNDGSTLDHLRVFDLIGDATHTPAFTRGRTEHLQSEQGVGSRERVVPGRRMDAKIACS